MSSIISDKRLATRINVAVILILFSPIGLCAQSNHPVIPKTGVNANAFIPKGWKLIYQAKGDLNRDGQTDEAIIIENTNPNNIVKNDGLGGEKLNVNPRMILLLFKTADQYKLITQNTAFIPTENDTVRVCLYDPLKESGAITIKNGKLILSYQYWLSCGSYDVSNVNYTFRFQNHTLELIGFDGESFSRSSGEETITSINFSTSKKSETSGGNMFTEKVNKPKTVWKKIKPIRLFNLSEMTDAIAQGFWDL